VNQRDPHGKALLIPPEQVTYLTKYDKEQLWQLSSYLNKVIIKWCYLERIFNVEIMCRGIY